LLVNHELQNWQEVENPDDGKMGKVLTQLGLMVEQIAPREIVHLCSRMH
jgi:hypothetical protein